MKSLIEDGVSKIDLNIINDDKENEVLLEASKERPTTLGPSLEQKVSVFTYIYFLFVLIRALLSKEIFFLFSCMNLIVTYLLH